MLLTSLPRSDLLTEMARMFVQSPDERPQLFQQLSAMLESLPVSANEQNESFSAALVHLIGCLVFRLASTDSFLAKIALHSLWISSMQHLSTPFAIVQLSSLTRTVDPSLARSLSSRQVELDAAVVKLTAPITCFHPSTHQQIQISAQSNVQALISSPFTAFDEARLISGQCLSVFCSFQSSLSLYRT